MKRLCFAVLAIVIVFSSCVSLTDREMSRPEMAEANVVGSVTTNFTVFRFMHFIGSSRKMREKAHTQLLSAARREHGVNVEIRNIVIQGSASGWGALYGIGVTAAGTAVTLYTGTDDEFVGAGLGLIFGVGIGHFQKITATGDVVLLGSSGADTRTTSGIEDVIEGALERAVQEISRDFSPRARIAIDNITAPEGLTEFITGELEYILQSRGFVIVNRSELDRIRAEQHFGRSGEIDENTAAQMGNMAGANIIIIGRIDGQGNLRRLRLSAIDTTTATLLGSASERL